MRQIKFRGKSVHSGEWLYGSLMINNEQRLIIPIPDYPENMDWGLDQNAISETIGQFTGMYDKLGNEVFEGDIVSYFILKDDKNRPEPSCYWLQQKEDVVKFEEGCFCVDGEHMDWIGIRSLSNLELYFGEDMRDGYGNPITELAVGFMIIGNVHDNPDGF